MPWYPLIAHIVSQICHSSPYVLSEEFHKSCTHRSWSSGKQTASVATTQAVSKKTALPAMMYSVPTLRFRDSKIAYKTDDI